jgi:Protein of unknown function (DUF3105)
MLMQERSVSPGSSRFRRVHVPIVLVLLVLLPIGPVGWFWGRADAKPGPRPASTLAQIATRAGCRLDEFHDGMDTNPPVTGRFRERARTADGSYIGKPQPTLEATIHAVFHGRVVFQFRPGLAERELGTLDRLTRADPDRVLLVENQTGMTAAVAATAYLSVMTCPRVDQPALAALDAFRERRRAFGQRF